MAEIAELAEEAVPTSSTSSSKQEGKARASKPKAKAGLGAVVKKRWRAWLRAVHRDVGYIAVGFTVIYALSGIAMNHIEDWDPNFHASEVQFKIAPIPDDVSDDEAVARIAAAAGISGTPSDVFRAGDEVRLEYPNGSKITAIGDTVTAQKRDSRFFFRVANWLHATRGKAAWKYISDVYAALLLYLAISGIFMIKGKLGLRWRGTILIAVGLGAPIAYIVLSGGPDAQKQEAKVAASKPGDDGIRPLPPEPAERAPSGAAPAGGAAAETPRRPPVLKQPPAEEMPQRPPVLKQQQ
ncbi:MAG TPA: PepSY-associated TM helix domain-containing protein [Kofleriaceae bacterium]|nr:PepSY-associated TM helix domain-containing protein [Kofleriaceae bacterium]